jgi:type II secretory pathway pseudopilin PulG
MGILGILLVALLPKISALGSTQSITQAYGAIPDLLRQARAYAMANNTYVYVGIEQGTGTNVDKVYLGIVASKDGTSNISGGAFKNTKDDLTALNRIQVFDGVKMTEQPPTNIEGFNPSGDGRTLEDGAVTFPSTLITSNSGVETFKKVIQFTPGGAAYLATLNTVQVPSSYILASFAPAHGNEKNAFGVQVDGMTGAVRAFRPDVN